MATVYDVPPQELIKRVAKKLNEMGVEKPAFVDYVKSGAHVERPPEQKDFWWIRCASILRKAYINKRVGVNRLRREYSAKKNNGVKPEHRRLAGGKIIRKALQTLEQHGLLKKAEDGKGRVITPKGMSLLDKTANEIAGEKHEQPKQ